jgi:hypothetical protein
MFHVLQGNYFFGRSKVTDKLSNNYSNLSIFREALPNTPQVLTLRSSGLHDTSCYTVGSAADRESK